MKKNIFGKRWFDYQFLKQQLHGKGFTDAQVVGSLTKAGFAKELWEFDAQRLKAFTGKSRKDAEASGYGLILNNMEAMTAEIEEIYYGQFKLDRFIPLGHSVPEGAQTFGVRVIDRQGKAGFINKDGTNVNTASASMSKIVFSVEYAGIMPTWNRQELAEVIFTGVSLSAETLTSATEACFQHIQDVGFLGDSDVGFTGLLTDTNIPTYGGTVPVFESSTPTQIIGFLNKLVGTIGTSTDDILFEQFGTTELVIALPPSAMNYISTTPFGEESSGRTILSWFMMNNLWTGRTGQTVRFEADKRLTTAGTNGRIIVYPFNPRVLTMEIPIMPRVINVFDRGYTTEAPMEYSMSPVILKRPKMILNADGVLA